MHGRESNSVTATVGLTDVTVMGANLGRRQLTINPPTTGRVSFQWGRASVLDQGFTIMAGTPPVFLSFDTLGADVMNELHAIADAAGRIISVIETIEPRH